MTGTDNPPAGNFAIPVKLACLSFFCICLSSCALPALLKPVLPTVFEAKLKRENFGEVLEEALKDPESEEGKIALGLFVEEWALNRKYANQGELTVTTPDGSQRRYEVKFNEDTVAGLRGLEYFDQVHPAAGYKVKRIERFTREGIGAPLLATRENEGKEPIEQFYPLEVISRSITAVITKDVAIPGGRHVEISLLSPLRHETVTVNGVEKPLAADFSVSWAGMLARTRDLQKLQIIDALTPDPKRDPQLFLMEPYDASKEPVIMIHGLFSSPLIWAEMSNNLWADKEFRTRYQIWHYLYNTSALPLYSGRILRTQLGELRPMLDPELDDPAMQQTTVIAHSMGGIVTRCLVTEPKGAYWNAAFTKPLAELKLDDRERETLKNAFYWTPETHVKRVIYIAVPHLGSEFADNPLGKLGRSIVKPPNQFSTFYKNIAKENPGAFTPDFADLADGKLNSVHALSPKQPTLEILASLPNSHPVKSYSIIGDRGRKCELEKASDGLVPYTSAHLEGVLAELILPLDHVKAVEDELTLKQILRILTDPESVPQETQRIPRKRNGNSWFHDSTGD